MKIDKFVMYIIVINSVLLAAVYFTLGLLYLEIDMKIDKLRME